MLSWVPVLHSVHLNATQLLKFRCENINIPPVCVVMDTCPALSSCKHNTIITKIQV